MCVCVRAQGGRVRFVPVTLGVGSSNRQPEASARATRFTRLVFKACCAKVRPLPPPTHSFTKRWRSKTPPLAVSEARRENGAFFR